jgi:hypothetical protein
MQTSVKTNVELAHAFASRMNIRTESHNELYAPEADWMVTIMVLTIVAHSNNEI